MAVHGIVKFNGAAVFGHFKAPYVRFSCVNARLHLFGGKAAAGAVVAGVCIARFFGGGALGVEVFFFAEARIHRVALFERFEGCSVSVKAFSLVVGAKFAAYFGAFVPLKTQPAHGAQDNLGVFDGRALRVGVFDAQHEGAAHSAGECPVVNSGASAANVQLTRRRRCEAYANGIGHVVLLVFVNLSGLVLKRACVRMRHAAKAAWRGYDARARSNFPMIRQTTLLAPVAASHTAPIPIQNSGGYMQMSKPIPRKGPCSRSEKEAVEGGEKAVEVKDDPGGQEGERSKDH